MKLGRKDDVTSLVLQSRVGDKPLYFQVLCPQNGTAVLKGLKQHEQHLSGDYIDCC